MYILLVVCMLVLFACTGESSRMAEIRRYAHHVSDILNIKTPNITEIQCNSTEVGWNVFRGMEIGICPQQDYKDIIHHEFAHSIAQGPSRDHGPNFEHAYKHILDKVKASG